MGDASHRKNNQGRGKISYFPKILNSKSKTLDQALHEHRHEQLENTEHMKVISY